MQVRNLGLIEYSEALEIQMQTVARLQEGPSEGNPSNHETILICEHPLVVTVGRALNAIEEVFTKEIPVHEISRGGRATLHLPGQVVVYPIIDLAKRGKDLHAYMRVLELAVIDTLADFRIEGSSLPGKTGVWVEKKSKKIASLGIAVKNWITYHGIALNVNCDLEKFSAISPCGFSSDVMTSMLAEFPERYKSEWIQTKDRLFRDVSQRLAENLSDRLESNGLGAEEKF